MATAERRSANLSAPRLLLTFALVLTSLAYINTVRFAFVYDDLPQIVNNPRVHSWARVPQLFSEHGWTLVAGQSAYYRPVRDLWLLLNYSLFGVNPAGYHITTVALHLLVTVLVYLLLKRICADPLTAAIATVIFALHPTHIESVAWISGVPDALMSAFVLLGILAYARWREFPQRYRWLALSVVCYAIAILVKETAALMPAALLAYDWLFTDSKTQRNAGWAAFLRAVMRCLPYAVVAVAYLAIRHAVLGGIVDSEAYPLTTVLATLPLACWFYIRELVWPVGLTVFPDVRLVQVPGLWNLVLPALGSAVVIGGVAWIARRSRAASFAASWMVIFMIPPIIGLYTFMAVDIVHDRYLYLPSIGFAVLVALAIRKLPAKGELLRGPALPMAMTLAVACAFAAATAVQNVDWTNDLILFAHAVKAAPKNPLALDHLANEYFKRGKRTEALELYSRSLAIHPDFWATRFALGLGYLDVGEFDRAGDQLQAAIPLLPRNPDQYYYLGVVRDQQGRFAEAERVLMECRNLDSAYPGLNVALGFAYEKQGKTDRAIDAYRAELINHPGSPAAAAGLQRLQAASPTRQ